MGEKAGKGMIGSRKVQDPTDLGVEDLSFYYEQMVKSHLLELEIETANGKIVLKRLSREAKAHPLRRKTDFLGEEESSAHPASAAFQTANPPSNGKSIRSPIIGVFYRSSSPQSAPFVKEGDVVEERTTVCIVEAMKVMNEIKADCRCRIIKILVENAKPITKDQPLFHVEQIP